MFAGIVEAESPVLSVRARDQVLELEVARPTEFNDLKTGDSVAVDGVCLTIENVGDSAIVFALAPETLKITAWNETRLRRASVNLERSLKFGERLHGHLVSGHVDAQGEVILADDSGEARWLDIRLPIQMRPYVWPKGSIAVNGVSLTVNEVKDEHFSTCLIPETMKRTNLSKLQVGDLVNLEVDPVARGLVHWLKTAGSATWN